MPIKALLQKGRMFWQEYKRDKTAVFGLGLVVFVVLIAIFAPLIAPHDPFSFVSRALSPPSSKNLFGTDSLGRDVFSRVVWGSRVSLLFGLGAAGLSGLIGIILGSIPAYHGGWLDDLLSRVYEFILIIPTIFLLILVVALFGSDIYFIMVVVGLTMWPYIARIMRAQVLSLKSKAYVQAAVGLGASNLQILFKHIIPNGIYPVTANITIQIAYAILTEAGLSFLGLGDTRQISWGQILYWGHLHVVAAWWNTLFAGIAIVVLALGFTLIGDGINNTLNPRLRERR